MFLKTNGLCRKINKNKPNVAKSPFQTQVSEEMFVCVKTETSIETLFNRLVFHDISLERIYIYIFFFFFFEGLLILFNQ